jgi:light-regulated signal transduction histidine kinase (bacteriophytochrome)
MTVSVRRHRAEIEALNSEMESFSYSVSHDLRAPVRAVIGFAAALQEEYAPSLDDEGKRLLSIVANEAQRLNLLIDGLLVLSRLGRVPMEIHPIDMSALAGAVAGEQAALAATTPGIEIGDLPSVDGDPTLLRQVWSQLLSNAVKFSSLRTKPQLTISASVETERIVYHVRDNGAGFEMAYAGQLFGIFQKLHSNEAFTGIGVGLAIVKRIVHRHGGSVWADARLGEGATFSFALPSGVA